jgi:hypothetical protein
MGGQLSDGRGFWGKNHAIWYESLPWYSPTADTISLWSTPKPITYHIVAFTQPVFPVPDAMSKPPLDTTTPLIKNAPRQRHPKELLKHKFLLTVSKAPINGEVSDAEVVKLGEVDVFARSPSKGREHESEKRKGEELQRNPRSSRRHPSVGNMYGSSG